MTNGAAPLERLRHGLGKLWGCLGSGQEAVAVGQVTWSWTARPGFDDGPGLQQVADPILLKLL